MKVKQILNEAFKWSQVDALSYFKEMLEDWSDEEYKGDHNYVVKADDWKKKITPAFKKELAAALSKVDTDEHGEAEENIVEARTNAMHKLIKKYKIGKTSYKTW